MKKHLIIVHTDKHSETIFTEDPNAEVNKIMQLYNVSVNIIILDGNVIYSKSN